MTRGGRALSRFAGVPRSRTSSGALLALSAAVAIVAGCGGGGDAATGSTEAVPPDRLAVSLRGDAGPDIRFDLDCGVADRPACAAKLAAIGDADQDETCTAAAAESDARIVVTGTISGDRVSALLGRRTDCEIRVYDRVIDGLGL